MHIKGLKITMGEFGIKQIGKKKSQINCFSRRACAPRGMASMHGRVGGSPEKGFGVPVVRSGVYVYSGRKAKALHCTGPGKQDEHLGHSPGKMSDAEGGG